jgi:hypothetical protein
MRTLPVLILALALFGCGAQTKSADTATTSTPATESHGADAVTASQPNEIAELSDQKMIYECPKCGMDFDGPGKCTMDGTELVQTQVAYICPADNKEVDKAGKCPRCAMNARVVKTVVAANTTTPTSTTPAPSGN